MNWAPIIEFGAAVLVALLGLMILGVGVVAALDPEGRGGDLFVKLGIAGVLLIIGGVGGALYIVFW